jgi:hypothetical protein
MCGDFDDHERVDDEMFERFAELAGHFGVTAGPADTDAPSNLEGESVRAAYMEQFFKTGLKRSLNDAANLPHGEHMDALAGQAIVFARLAGFIAGQFPPQTDLFRTLCSALLDGHNEPVSVS